MTKLSDDGMADFINWKHRKRVTYREARKAELNAASDARRAAGLSHHAGKRGTKVEADWRRQIASLPVDTRSLTAAVFGDPLPGRSALDRYLSIQGED